MLYTLVIFVFGDDRLTYRSISQIMFNNPRWFDPLLLLYVSSEILNGKDILNLFYKDP